jgi:hypothetical protein
MRPAGPARFPTQTCTGLGGASGLCTWHAWLGGHQRGAAVHKRAQLGLRCTPRRGQSPCHLKTVLHPRPQRLPCRGHVCLTACLAHPRRQEPDLPGRRQARFRAPAARRVHRAKQQGPLRFDSGHAWRSASLTAMEVAPWQTRQKQAASMRFVGTHSAPSSLTSGMLPCASARHRMT